MVLTPLSRLNPMTELTYFTPGVLRMRCSASRAASEVRCREEASGSWRPPKTYPWSSSGRKPLGTLLPKKAAPAVSRRSRRKAKPALWMRWRQVLTYPSVARPKARLNQRKKAPSGRVRLPLTQQHRRQSRAEGERVEGGKDDRHGDGDGELLVQQAGDTGNEGRRNKDGGQDESDGDDRSGDFLHGLHGRVVRRHSLFNVVLDGLDDDDGVIDDQADGEHEPEKRESVDGEAEQGKNDKGSDERNRNSEQRDEGGAGALKKDVDDDDDEDQRFA